MQTGRADRRDRASAPAEPRSAHGATAPRRLSPRKHLTRAALVRTIEEGLTAAPDGSALSGWARRHEWRVRLEKGHEEVLTVTLFDLAYPEDGRIDRRRAARLIGRLRQSQWQDRRSGTRFGLPGD
jgi:hypothetical protein